MFVLVGSLIFLGVSKFNQNTFNSAQNNAKKTEEVIVNGVLPQTPVEEPLVNTAANLKPVKSGVVTTTPRPTVTPKPVSSSTPTATATYVTMPVGTPMSTTPTPTPTPAPDTQTPVFQYLNGPGEGNTVTFNGFCFPMYITDNVSVIATGLMVRYSFDNSGFSDWKQDFAPCYQNVSDGAHTFVVQARDGAGNMTGNMTKSFTVQTQVASPSPSSL